MAQKPRLLTISSANMDLMMKMRTVPQPGETVKEKLYGFIPGGKGANAALAAARLGADSIFCTRLGNDVNGKALCQFYRESGIDTRFISFDLEEKTGFAAIMVEDDGSNRIVVYPGANQTISREDVDDALSSLPDALFLQMEIAPEIVTYATERAKSKCVPVFLDAGPADAAFPLESLKNIEIFSPNEVETETFCGIRPDTMQNCMRASIALYRRVHPKFVVIKLGARGSFWYDGTYSKFVEAYEVKAVDTTAAGDAFSAAMTLEYLRSRSIDRAVEYATVVGALTVMKAGAAPSLPTAKEVHDFVVNNRLELDF